MFLETGSGTKSDELNLAILNAMTQSSRSISPGLSRLFVGCALMNVGGATVFAPPLTGLRLEMGLPEPPPMYLWILSFWILIFGASYLNIARVRYFEPTLLAVAAAGKATFSLAMIGTWLGGGLPMPAALSSLPDLLLAFFFVWLIRTS